MRISDWSSDVCSSDLEGVILEVIPERKVVFTDAFAKGWIPKKPFILGVFSFEPEGEGTRYRGIARHWDEAAMKQHQEMRSEEHTSELQSLMRISYAVFCLKKKKINIIHNLKDINN